MIRWWSSEGRPAFGFCAALIVGAGVSFGPAASAHPDLLAQIARMDEQIRAEPDNPDWLIRRGELHRRHAEYGAAARDFKAARVLAPNHPDLDFYQGRLALDAGNPDLAVSHLDRYLRTHCRHAVAWRLQAEARLVQGNHAAAARSFERAIRFGDAPSPALYRQWVLALLAAGHQAAALAAIDQGLARVGLEVTLLGIGADVALSQRDAARARSYLDRLPAGLRGHPPWRDRIEEAECLEASGEVGNCLAGARRRLGRQLQS